MGIISSVKKHNSSYRNVVGTYLPTLTNAVKGLETIFDFCLKQPLQNYKNSLCDSTLPLLCSCNFTSSLDEKSRLISFLAAPVTLKYLGKSVITHIEEAKKSSSDFTKRTYHVAKATLSLAHLGGMAFVVQKGLFILGKKIEILSVNYLLSSNKQSAFCQFAEGTSKAANAVFGKVTKLFVLASVVQPVIHGIEFLQATRLLKGEATFQDIKKECFGEKSERSKAHIAKFRRYKMALTANAVVEFFARRVMILSSTLTPGSYLLILGTTITKISLNHYWKKQISDETHKNESREIVRDIAALSVLIALPFISLPAYAPYAFGVLVGATAAEMISNLRKRSDEN